MPFPVQRLRRLRGSESIRNLVRETRLEPSQFILPLFVCPGEGVRREIGSMPGNYQLSIDELVKECAEARSLGIGGVILFGLPESTPDDARNAALCCVDLSNRTQQWIASLPPTIASQTGFKIGAHFGAVITSRLGGGSYQHITATGDTVNVASRLMEVAARQDTALALSDDLLRRVGRECALFDVGVLTGPSETRIRGRSRALSVWLWRP